MADRVSKYAGGTAQPRVETVPCEPAPVHRASAAAPLLLRTAAQLLQISERKLLFLLKDRTIAVMQGRAVYVSPLSPPALHSAAGVAGGIVHGKATKATQRNGVIL